jgi:hypothetical protein
MIIKASLGNGFSGALQYIHKTDKELKENERPQIIEKNNVLGSNPKFLAYQMREQANKSGYSKKPVLHLSFAFAPEDKLTPAKEIESVKASMQHLGITEEKNQYVIVKHNDSSHSHYHAIINKVDSQNQILDTNWIKNKCVVTADRIEQEYNLYRVQGRNIVFEDTEKGYKYIPKEERTNNIESHQSKGIPALNEYQTKVQQGITEVLANKSVKTFDDLKTELSNKNIKARFNIDETTNQVKGTSFRLNDKSAVNISGSKIGYSANTINQKLEENQAKAKEISKEVAEPKREIMQFGQAKRKAEKEKLAELKPEAKAEPPIIKTIPAVEKVVSPGAKSAPGPTNKLEPKTEQIRKISNFEFTIKNSTGEYGFVKYSKNFKNFEVQNDQGKIFTIENNKNFTFSKHPNREFNSIELDMLKRGNKFIQKGVIPYKTHKSERSEIILFSTLTEKECIANKNILGIPADTFITQNQNINYEDNSIEDADKKKAENRNWRPRL